MKKWILSLVVSSAIFLTGCLETTQKITLNEDGSGNVSNISDMSALLTLIKQMGGAEADKMADQAKDTTIQLAAMVDSVKNLSPEEKLMMAKGVLRMNFNMKEDKFLLDMNFPFTSPAEIDSYSRLSAKIMSEILKDQMSEGAGAAALGGEQMPEPSSFDKYFETEFSNGVLSKKVNKDKYAGAAGDEYLKALKEAAGMGVPVTATTVFVLPRPADKVEGKNVQLSEDKKTVTVKADINDFFTDPFVMEFKIKY